MGFAYAKLHHFDGPTPLLRVIRKSQAYLCGICRRSHVGELAAKQCLGRCIRNFLNLIPIIIVEQPQGETYRCRFCCRDYDRHAEAKDCAVECREHLLNKDKSYRKFKAGEQKKPKKLRLRAKVVPLFTPAKVQEMDVKPQEIKKPLEEVAPLADLPSDTKDKTMAVDAPTPAPIPAPEAAAQAS